MRSSANGVLAVVAATGDARLLTGEFAGSPLVAWSVAAALQSGAGRVVVVSDDAAVRTLAEEAGAEAAATLPTLGRPDVIVTLTPWTPLRPPGLVNAAVARLMAHPEADGVGCTHLEARRFGSDGGRPMLRLAVDPRYAGDVHDPGKWLEAARVATGDLPLVRPLARHTVVTLLS